MIREIFGRKIGMTQVFNEEGDLVPVTLVEVEPAFILEKMSYTSKTKAKIACFKIEEAKTGKVKKPVLGYFKKLNVSPYKLIREVDIEGEIEEKKEVGLEILEDASLVNVRSKTKGRGFTGGMKRYNWRGQPDSHGHTSHRRIGSVGASAYPSKIVKGLHMPGHMGDKFQTVKNLKIIKIDKEKNLLFLRGSIPGSRGTVVKIKRTK